MMKEQHEMTRIADKYENLLCVTWGVRAPARCKITPARMEAAKAALASSLAQQSEARQWADTAVRQYVRKMVARLHCAGFKVARVKVPDGPRGSHYIVLTDGRHIRVADHYSATEGSRIVGGFSRALGRRHHAATRSIIVRRAENGGMEIKRDYK